VRGVDIKEHEFAPTQADEFRLLDLREAHNCWEALSVDGGTFDQVYQLAADMGGMGFIHTAEADRKHPATLCTTVPDVCYPPDQHQYDRHGGQDRRGSLLFLLISLCVPGYAARRARDDRGRGGSGQSRQRVRADRKHPAEKLYAERMAQTYARHYPIEVRIARFENCYGPYGTWRGGREKAPAAICRKVAMAKDGGAIPVWGDGSAIRNYTYVDDMVKGIYLLTQSDLEGPTNIGGEEYVTVAELVQTVIDVSGKEIRIEYVEGPVGVHSRNFAKARIKSLRWEAGVSLKEGIAKTYAWIEEQVRKTIDE
jgi:GDP-D-mannose 3',5'-epimerase